MYVCIYICINIYIYIYLFIYLYLFIHMKRMCPIGMWVFKYINYTRTYMFIAPLSMQQLCMHVLQACLC